MIRSKPFIPTERKWKMKSQMIFTVLIALLLMAQTGLTDETYFFWYGSVPDSVSWAPFDWEGQDRSSGFATSVLMGEFYNHTPDVEDARHAQSLTFSIDSPGNMGAHHPTVLPGGIGTVSLWLYYDYTFGFASNGDLNTIYISVQPGADLVNDNYIGVELEFNETNFRIVSSDNASGEEGPAINIDDWNHFEFTDDGSSTKVKINGEEAGLSLPTGGNMVYFNFVDGRVNSDGSISDGECLEMWYIDDIVCTSTIESGFEIIDAPLTSNSVTIDGVIEPAEISGANSVTWDGSSTERPGVHAQFYGQWQLPTPEDLTATVYLQNDGTHLYISIDVVDDVILIAESTSWWEEDSTEIYIDHDNSRSSDASDQISVRADNGIGNQDNFADWLNIDSKVKSDDSGWQVEAEIDMAARSLSQDETYGFDISINDSDGENESGYQGAQEWLYASFEWAYNDETYWGNIRILSEETIVPDWSIFE
jgi:hypothetical protein